MRLATLQLGQVSALCLFVGHGNLKILISGSGSVLGEVEHIFDIFITVTCIRLEKVFFVRLRSPSL